MSLPGLTGQSSNPCTIDAAEALPYRDSGGYWIARSSRAMTVASVCADLSDYANFAFFSGRLRTGLPVAA
jgi:hypothetical protein